MKPKKLRKLISELGIFWSQEFFNLLLLVFVANYWFIETDNSHVLMNLIPSLILLMSAGFFAQIPSVYVLFKSVKPSESIETDKEVK